MKIRNPKLISAASWLGAQVVRAWMRTMHYEYRPLGPNVDPRQDGMAERYIYAFWHENLLAPLSQYAQPNIRVLISRHADGQIIAELARHLGFGLVRGSSTRGGVEAVRQMLRLGQEAHLAVTPDGPRGPRRRIQLGLIYLAAHTGLPIVPVGIGYRRPWRMKSWDHFAIPKPGSFMTCVTPDPISISPDAGKEDLEHHQQHVEQVLHQVGAFAEHWAGTGIWPESEIRSQKLEVRSQAKKIAG
jgi:lysophospholipid acyltransferase (LPLAT)-like uncharacterized protein